VQAYNKSELNMTSMQSKYAQVINPTLLVNKLSTNERMELFLKLERLEIWFWC